MRLAQGLSWRHKRQQSNEVTCGKACLKSHPRIPMKQVTWIRWSEFPTSTTVRTRHERLHWKSKTILISVLEVESPLSFKMASSKINLTQDPRHYSMKGNITFKRRKNTVDHRSSNPNPDFQVLLGSLLSDVR